MVMSMEYPHRIVDRFLDDIINKVEDLGEKGMSMLDRGPLGDLGPHRGVDDLIDGFLDALKTFGEGVARALDRPLDLIERKL